MFGQWKALFKSIRRYFHAYGGVRGTLASPILCIAFIITALSYSKWLTPDWTARVETLIPSLLGFSLGTYAILFSIMSARLKGALRRAPAPNGVSYLEAINATFFHFIFVQVIALAWAFLFQGSWFLDLTSYFLGAHAWVERLQNWTKWTGSFIGYFFLIYSVLLSVASALAVYRLALIKDPNEG